MSDAEILSDESVLGSDIVIESDFGKWFDVGVGRRCRLSVSEECSDDYEVLLWIQGFIFPYKPFIVGNGLGKLSAAVNQRVEGDLHPENQDG
jgi:hypothetical protein